MKTFLRQVGKWTSWSALVLGSVGLTACGMGARQVVLQDDDYAARLISDPVVELMVEYSAPSADFAAAPAMTLQVSVREGAHAEFRLFHGGWNEVAGTPPGEHAPSIDGGAGRAPASVISVGSSPKAGKRYPKATWRMDGKKISDEMKDLAMAGRDPAAGYAGCAFPVKLRMVRAGGTVEELMGCRGAGGWTRRTSEAVERWMSAQKG